MSDRGIEVRGEIVFRFGERIGMTQGDTVHLFREISGIDKRIIREHYANEGRTVGFAKIGDIVGQ